MERQKEQADNLANEWYKRAQLALTKVRFSQSQDVPRSHHHRRRPLTHPSPPHDPQPRQGDEELAREALSRRQQQVEVATSLGEQMTVQAGAINKLFTSMQQLEAKITEAKVRPCVFACR